jgi:hypothetical protein
VNNIIGSDRTAQKTQLSVFTSPDICWQSVELRRSHSCLGIWRRPMEFQAAHSISLMNCNINISHIYCSIWVKSRVIGQHLFLLSIYRFCKNRRREGCTFLTSVSAIKCSNDGACVLCCTVQYVQCDPLNLDFFNKYVSSTGHIASR